MHFCLSLSFHLCLCPSVHSPLLVVPSSSGSMNCTYISALFLCNKSGMIRKQKEDKFCRVGKYLIGGELQQRRKQNWKRWKWQGLRYNGMSWNWTFLSAFILKPTVDEDGHSDLVYFETFGYTNIQIWIRFIWIEFSHPNKPIPNIQFFWWPKCAKFHVCFFIPFLLQKYHLGCKTMQLDVEVKITQENVQLIEHWDLRPEHP